MGVKELITALGVAAALTPQPIDNPTRKRRNTDHDHFTPKEWEKRKKLNKAQRQARKIARQHAK